ncbi:MAG: hypothetical protein ACLGHP_04290 [Vicinamibacteria bacterium]
MRLPPVASLVVDTAGWGYYLCTQKEVRAGRKGDFIILTLVDRTGRVPARVFDQVERFRGEFDAGEFVASRRASRRGTGSRSCWSRRSGA